MKPTNEPTTVVCLDEDERVTCVSRHLTYALAEDHMDALEACYPNAPFDLVPTWTTDGLPVTELAWSLKREN